MKRLFIIALGLLACQITVFASKIGDKAAPLAVQTWVKGAPVDILDGKNIYVVEFWATWCGPCRTSIPHLSELQKKYKNKHVVFIGISTEEKELVSPFVKQMAEKMDYHVACDKEHQTHESFMKAYGQDGIPTAFIIGKEGKVLWLGHPMNDLESTLDEIVANKFDLSQAIKRDTVRITLLEYQSLMAKGDPKAKELGRQVLKDYIDDGKTLTMLAFETVATPKIPNRDFAFAESALDAAEKVPGAELHFIKAVRAITRFEAGKTEDGLKLIDEAIEMCEYAADKAQYTSFKRVMKARVEEVKQP